MPTLFDLIKNLQKQKLGPEVNAPIQAGMATPPNSEMNPIPAASPNPSQLPDEDEAEWQQFKQTFQDQQGLTPEMVDAIKNKERFKLLKSKFKPSM